MNAELIISKTVSVRDCACSLIPFGSVVGVRRIGSGGDGNYKMFFSLRFIALNIRDGWFFRPKKVSHACVGMPLVSAALIPRVTLQKINDALESLEKAKRFFRIYDRAKKKMPNQT